MSSLRQNNFGFLVVVVVFFTAFSATPNAAKAQVENQVSLDIPAGPLADTLRTLTTQYDESLVAADSLLANRQSPSITGRFTFQQALREALDGTGLEAQKSGTGAYVLATAQIVESKQNPGSKDRTGGAKPEIEELIVTGSRLDRSAIDSPAPVTTVTADDIVNLGLTDTTEALRTVPALTASQTLTTTSDEDVAGLAALNLRSLGANRTLVLVNGRRHVAGVENSATVDVGTIPSALIERVEILTGGGSSIYGADAVSGVVNYVLKEDFEGVNVIVNTGLPTRGGGESVFAAITAGGNFDEGRGNAAVNFEYFDQSTVFAADRSSSRLGSSIAQNNAGLSAALGVDPNFQNILVPNARNNVTFLGPYFSFTGSSVLNTFIQGGSPAGYGGFPLVQVVDPVTGIRGLQDVPFISGSTTQGGDGISTRFPNPRFDVVPDLERFILNAIADYEFNDRITGFVEAKYVRAESRSTTSFQNQIFDVAVRADNPFIPEVVQQQLDSLEDQSLDANLNVTRLPLDDKVNAPTESRRDTVRVVGGFKGEISSGVNYEISANYGETRTSIANSATLIPDRLFAAYDAVIDPVTGQPICRSDIDPETLPPLDLAVSVAAPGFRSFVPGDGSCSPLNIFAPFNTLSPEGVEFVFLPTQNEFDLSQLVLNATVTGNTDDIFELPAGAIGYAAGFEYREEKGESRPDPLFLTNIASRLPFETVGGSFDVFEAFAEVNIPILADLPFAKLVTLDASVRTADYSTVGRTTSFGVGAVWQPIVDLRFRGSYNRAVRAPNIGELFSPQTSNLGNLGVEVDPCDPARIDQGTSTRRQNCSELIPNLDDFDPVIVPLSTVFVEGGNPDLSEETADTYSIGFAYTPSSLPGLTVSADYYSIEIGDAVATVSQQQLLETCVDAPTINNPSCDAIGRNPQTGLIERIQRTSLNLSSAVAEGIDYQISYAFTLDSLVGYSVGSFTAQLGGTYLAKREDQPFETTPESNDRLEGEFNNPEHVVNFSLSWSRGSWTADYAVNYQSTQVPGGRFGIEQVEEDGLLLDRPFSGGAFVHFLGGAYDFGEKFRLSFRVNNLFDRDPFEFQATRQGFRPTSFLGRTVQVGLNANF